MEQPAAALEVKKCIERRRHRKLVLDRPLPLPALHVVDALAVQKVQRVVVVLGPRFVPRARPFDYATKICAWLPVPGPR